MLPDFIMDSLFRCKVLQAKQIWVRGFHAAHANIQRLESCSDIVSLYVGQCQEVRMHLKAQCKMMLQRWARANTCYHLNLSTGWETDKTGYLLGCLWTEKPMNQIKRALNNWLKYYSPFWLYYRICSYFHVSSIEIPSHSDTLFSGGGNSFLCVMFQTNL